MEHIKKVLSKRVKQSGFAPQVKTALVIEEFKNLIKEIFDSEIAQKIKPLHIRQGVLTITCRSSVLAQELNFKKADIIEGINRKFNEEVLKEIKFVI